MKPENHRHVCSACGDEFPHKSKNCIAARVAICEDCFVRANRMMRQLANTEKETERVN
jgi:hypothetical protein